MAARALRLCGICRQDYLAREGQARTLYPEEVEKWYAFLTDNFAAVEELMAKVNELADGHEAPPLRPMVATPLVLKLRKEEVAAAALEVG